MPGHTPTGQLHLTISTCHIVEDGLKQIVPGHQKPHSPFLSGFLSFSASSKTPVIRHQQSQRSQKFRGHSRVPRLGTVQDIQEEICHQPKNIQLVHRISNDKDQEMSSRQQETGTLPKGYLSSFLQRLVLQSVFICQINSKHQNRSLSPNFRKRLAIYMKEI